MKEKKVSGIDFSYYFEDFITPVRFFPYTSSVRKRIVEINNYSRFSDIKEFEMYLIKTFQEKGIKCEIDNKIVFEVRLQENTIYFGFYDGVFSIGFDVDSYYRSLVLKSRKERIEEYTKYTGKVQQGLK